MNRWCYWSASYLSTLFELYSSSANYFSTKIFSPYTLTSFPLPFLRLFSPPLIFSNFSSQAAAATKNIPSTRSKRERPTFPPTSSSSPPCSWGPLPSQSNSLFCWFYLISNLQKDNLFTQLGRQVSSVLTPNVKLFGFAV